MENPMAWGSLQWFISDNLNCDFQNDDPKPSVLILVKALKEAKHLPNHVDTENAANQITERILKYFEDLKKGLCSSSLPMTLTTTINQLCHS